MEDISIAGIYNSVILERTSYNDRLDNLEEGRAEEECNVFLNRVRPDLEIAGRMKELTHERYYDISAALTKAQNARDNLDDHHDDYVASKLEASRVERAMQHHSSEMALGIIFCSLVALILSIIDTCFHEPNARNIVIGIIALASIAVILVVIPKRGREIHRLLDSRYEEEAEEQYALKLERSKNRVSHLEHQLRKARAIENTLMAYISRESAKAIMP